MSIHKECGEHIHWFQREDDRFYPPMEYAGVVYVNIDGKLVETTGYRHHRCDPEKVAAWVEYLNTMEELKGPDSFEGAINAHIAASERHREELWEHCLKVDCPRCPAIEGERCVNLSFLKKTGELVEVRYPHLPRQEEATR